MSPAARHTRSASSSAAMAGEVNGYVASGAAYTIGFFLIKAGGALIDNMHWLFAIGVAVGMAKDKDGTAGLAGLVSWLMITKLLNTAVVTVIMPSIANNEDAMLAFGKIENPFIGIIAGLLGAACYNRFKDTKLPDWLSFFSGKRCVAIVTAVVSIVVAAILLFVWPIVFGALVALGEAIVSLDAVGAGLYAFFNRLLIPTGLHHALNILLFVWPIVFGALVALGEAIVSLDAVGAGLYAFFNRLLIPTGLHHALNNVFWFDTIGLGDLQNFWAGKVTGDMSLTNAPITWSLGMYMSGFFPCMMFGIPGAALAMVHWNFWAGKVTGDMSLTNAPITWSLGMYMSGFFPCMMFGIPGAALAMVHCAKSNKKKIAIGLVGSAALCAFICGVTEPFEFAFMFLAPALYVVYALLYGIFAFVTVALGFRAGFSFSAGLTDLVFSASLPAAAKTLLIIPLGIAAFVVFYIVFRIAISKFNLKTPGREDDDDDTAAQDAGATLANNDFTAIAATVLEGLGGRP